MSGLAKQQSIRYNLPCSESMRVLKALKHSMYPKEQTICSGVCLFLSTASTLALLSINTPTTSGLLLAQAACRAVHCPKGLPMWSGLAPAWSNSTTPATSPLAAAS